MSDKKTPKTNSSVNSSEYDWGLEEVIREIESKEDLLSSEPSTELPKKAWDLLLLFVLVLLAIFVTLAGAWYRGEALSSLPKLISQQDAPRQLLDVQDGKFLLLESEDKHNQVFVQLPNQAEWWYVSKGDSGVANPSLSSDGAWVAYLSIQNSPQLVIASMEQQQGVLTYTSTLLEDFGYRNNVLVTNICPWTPVAWSEDDTRLAFFGCNEDPPQSITLVADWLTATLTLQPEVITGTVISGLEPRDLLWVDTNQIAITFQSEPVRTFSVR
jgi:hypothetical protein